MRLITRIERLERLRGTAMPTDKVPLEVFRRFIDRTNSVAEYRRWGPQVKAIIAAGMEDGDVSEKERGEGGNRETD